MPSAETEATGPVLGFPLDDQTPPEGTNGITFDALGGLWIADLAGDQILRVDPADGTIVARHGVDAGVRTPDDLVLDSQGRLWWTDNGTGDVGRIWYPLVDGTISETVAQLGAGANPIAIAADDSVYVARTLAADELYRLDEDAVVVPTLLRSPAGQLNGFAFGDDGILYAPRYVDGSGRVSAIDPETGEATDLVSDLPLPVSVKVAPDGTLRVLTIGPSRVSSVDPDTGKVEPLVDLPSAVVDNMAFDAAGDLWVSTFDQPTLWRIPAGDDPTPVEVSIGR